MDWLFIIGWSITGICLIWANLGWRHWRIKAAKLDIELHHAYHQRAEWERLATLRSNHAQSYLDAARLIEIHRSGRKNVFTFARNDYTFTIETMGMLSDEPTEWRKSAGL